MSTNDSAALQTAANDRGIDHERLARAVTEAMTAYDEGGDIYSVSTQSGAEYRVDVRERRCTCPRPGVQPRARPAL